MTLGAGGDAGADAGALDAGVPGALPGSDGGLTWLSDASTLTGLDAAASGARDGGALVPGFTPTEPDDDRQGGCALGSRPQRGGLAQLALLVALGALLRRRRR